VRGTWDPRWITCGAAPASSMHRMDGTSADCIKCIACGDLGHLTALQARARSQKPSSKPANAQNHRLAVFDQRHPQPGRQGHKGHSRPKPAWLPARWAEWPPPSTLTALADHLPGTGRPNCLRFKPLRPSTKSNPQVLTARIRSPAACDFRPWSPTCQPDSAQDLPARPVSLGWTAPQFPVCPNLPPRMALRLDTNDFHSRRGLRSSSLTI